MPDPPTRSGLYANLLEPSASSNSSSTSASISRAPVVFATASSTTDKAPIAADSSPATATASSAQKKLNAAALRFQPTITKRPQLNAKNAKPKIAMKPIGGLSAAAAAAAAGVSSTEGTASGPARPIVKTTLEDWTGDGDDDVNGFYSSKPHGPARGGKKRRKKNKDTPPPPTNWDDVYDPSRPNSYEEYREGDEKIREMEDWRERVYGRRRRGRDDSYDSEDDEGYKAVSNRFAPPSKYSFAPPPQQTEAPPPPPPPPAEVPDDASGEDAYARRIRMSQIGQAGYASAASQPTPPPPPVPTFYPPPQQHQYAPPPTTTPPPPPPPPPAVTISRAPVRYSLPSTPTEQDQSSPPPPSNPTPDPIAPEAEAEEEEERSLRPGQANFAARLMSKYGWTSGTGLGADSSGIVQPLRMVAASKAKDQVGRGKIIDKNKRSGEGEEGKFGKMSEVIVLRAMVDGLEGEDEAVLLQEIEEECQAKYGTVERVLVDWGRGGGEGVSRVFVQFTSQLSALRAVNALEGRLFNGNTIGARFFDKEKFENRDFS